MGIFDLEDWRSLWNLNDSQKGYPSHHSSFSVDARLNRSYGNLPTGQRRYLSRVDQDVTDARSYNSLGRQISSPSGRRAGSLPPPTDRHKLKQAPAPKIHNANGMVESTSIHRPDGEGRDVPPVRKQSAGTPANYSSSEPKASTSLARQNSSGVQRPVSKIALSNDSSWIKSRQELDSSAEFVDVNNKIAPTRSQPYASKEPVKNWEKQLSRKSNDNLSSRYTSPAKSSARDLTAAETSAFNEARFKFQQLAEASSDARSPDYNEPLRVKFRSQQNIQSDTNAQLVKQYQSAVGLNDYDYPKKNVEIQKRDSLYTRANSSGLPETSRSNTSYETKLARPTPAKNASAAGRNLALLGMSSDNSETEAYDTPVTSTPRSSTRKSKSHHVTADPHWETLDIILKRSKKNPQELGFELQGGLGEEVRPGDTKIYVSQINPGEAADFDGGLRVGDVIIAINGTDMKSMSHRTAKRLLRSSGSKIRLTVQRFVGKIHLTLITLSKNGQPLGLTITGGVGDEVPGGGTAIYVKKIDPTGVAYRTGGIEVGDQIQKVNNTMLTDVSHHFATECLKNATDPVALVIAKTGRINPVLFSGN